MTDNMGYDWTPTFEDLAYQAKLRGNNENTFATCEKCLSEGLENFDKEVMVRKANEYGIIVHFVSCKDHDGITK